MSIANRKPNQNNAEQPLLVVKLVFVGDSGAGKTSLLSREYDDSFTKQYLATIGVDFRIKTYDLGLIKLKAQLWDTAGQQRFRSIQKPYYKNAKAVCLCFSLADRKSFENLDHWIDQLIKFDVPRDTMFLIGCKSDLDVQVATDQIIVYAQSKNVNYFQTSSYTGQGVHQAFQSIMINIAQKQIQLGAQKKSQEKTQNKVLIQAQLLPAKKTCC